MAEFLWLVFGLALLIGGGFLLVKGASGIASRLHISPIIVGLTIIAFGTSAPELFVGVIAAVRDQTDIVFGNVIGSNIANLGLVLAVAAIIRPIEINGQIVRQELPLLLLSTTAILVMALDPLLRGTSSVLDRSDGVVLLLLFLVFFYVTTLGVLYGRRESDSLLSDIDESPLISVVPPATHDWVAVFAGLLGLLIGGQLTISSGVALSALLDVPSAIVGLFVVAIGTSLPEMVTTIIAAIRREPDLALGNIIGSCLFNGLAVLPVSAIIRPVAIPAGGLFDLTISLLFAAVLIPVFWIGRARLGRKMGWIILMCYFAYATVRVL